jgi:NAD(P)-dependent dehydrogenase (short-subunit alcohol dehydrogenase family)
MQDFRGKAAFVTGGASGIGLALARAFAQAGARVMLADIEQNALDAAVAGLRGAGAAVRGIVCDVADATSVQRAASATFDAFGAVHVLCNNAGVGGGSGVDAISLETWRWVIDVNLMGVVHGIAAFLPHMLAHGEGGHIVNTASLAGLQANLGFSPYVASKYGVVGISEGLAVDLRDRGVGVSVLCPGFVRTQIASSARNRPERYGAAQKHAAGSKAAELAAHLAERAADGLDPDTVAARVLDAMRAGDLYVFTHPEMRGEVDERLAAIKSALDRTKT